MSTTVTYKGSTIATAENATKTLLTEGKYLEDDITIVDVTSGGGGSTLITKNISANGTYNASSDSADGYSSVTVAVPASAVDTGTKNITANGNNQDVVGYAAVNVAVPNSYSAGDEGKVVSNGALVSQTAHADVTPTTSDQTIDTTTNNSIKVKGDANLVAGNIKKDVVIFNTTGSYEGGGGGRKVTGTVTGNGTKTISISGVTSAPDIIVIYRSDLKNLTAVADRVQSAMMIYANVMTTSLWSASNAATISGSGGVINNGIGTSSSPSNNNAGLDNGTLYVTNAANSNLWSSSLTYVYELIYLS